MGCAGVTARSHGGGGGGGGRWATLGPLGELRNRRGQEI